MKQSNSHGSLSDCLTSASQRNILGQIKYIFSALPIVIFSCFSMVSSAQDSESDGGYEFNIGTTISHGIIYRMEDRNPAFDGTAVAPNSSQFPNNDDGDKNYDKGIVSSVTKVTSEIDISKDDFGFFTRLTGFIDYKNQGGNLQYRNLSTKAKRLVGSGVKLLDLYGYKNFEVGNVHGDVRVGNMVLNWGESTFIPNGINVVNPVDVSRLRTPGSELKEALEPVPMVSASVSPTDNLSIESFYQFKWKKTEIDPAGSYFSTVDYLGEGGDTAEINLRALPADDKDGWLEIPRRPDVEPKDSGQFGLGLRYLSQQLGDTEFGMFFTRYHSRLPVVSADSGATASSIDSAKTGKLLIQNGLFPIKGNIRVAPRDGTADS